VNCVNCLLSVMGGVAEPGKGREPSLKRGHMGGLATKKNSLGEFLYRRSQCGVDVMGIAWKLKRRKKSKGPREKAFCFEPPPKMDWFTRRWVGGKFGWPIKAGGRQGPHTKLGCFCHDFFVEKGRVFCGGSKLCWGEKPMGKQ